MLHLSLQLKLDTLKQLLKTKIKSPVSFSRKFPHINRKITAPLKTLKLGYFGLIIFLFIIGINLFSEMPTLKSHEQILQNGVLQNPFRGMPHQKLAEFYLDKNLAAAEKEYYLASETHQRQNNVNGKYLGIESPPWETYLNLLKNRSILEENLFLWVKIKTALPGYEYAYLKIADLYNRLGEKGKAGEILSEVLKINPAYQEAEKVQKKLGS